MAGLLPNPSACCDPCENGIRTSISLPDVIIDILDLFSADNVAALRLIATHPPFAILRGFSTPGDGGGGLYYYDVASTATDDGQDVIQPTDVTGAGRYIALARTNLTPINVKWFGARGNGTTNDTVAIQNALTASANTCELYFPPGTYIISSPLTNGATHIYLRGAGIANTKLQWSGAAGTAMFNWGTTGVFTSGWGLKDMTLDGASVTPILRVEYMNFGIVSHCRFDNTTAAINFIVALNNTVADNIFATFPTATSYAFTASGGSGHRFLRNYIRTDGIGVKITNATNALNIGPGNVFEFNDIAIDLQATSDSQLAAPWVGHNFFESNNTVIAVGATGAGDPPRAVMFVGNEVAQTGNGAITFTKAEGFFAMGNRYGVAVTYGALLTNATVASNFYTFARTISTTSINDLDLGGILGLGPDLALSRVGSAQGRTNFQLGISEDPVTNLSTSGITQPVTAYQLLSLRSTDALAADKGGGISFGGIYDGGGNFAAWAAIRGLKANATDSNLAAYLSLSCREAAGGWGESGRFDASATAGDTRFLLYDVTAATLKRVSVGASDSGGAGFKLLRVPN